jgi:hypothetical protein
MSTLTPPPLQDTLLLCEHIRDVGAQQWDILTQKLPCKCPAALCALRWHVLVLEQQRLNNTLKAPKWYSDWELCVLMLVRVLACPRRAATSSA